MQVIDYKSGNKPHLEYNGISSLFSGRPIERISNIFQTLLYSMMLHRTRGVDVKPSLYYASQMLGSDYSPLLVNTITDAEVERYSDVSEEFERELSAVLEELFDPSQPFIQVEDIDACKYCDYKKICRR